MQFNYDVIVVGAGHAGCEAAHAAARLGASTLLITMDMNKIAQMSCNPAIGGVAKGQIVREIDALGGMQGVITDSSSIQFRMLNRSKGPAVWSPRAQCDRMAYSAKWRNILENTPGLHIWQDNATSLTVTETDGTRRITGLNTALGVNFTAKAIILTNGTFLNGLMHVGEIQTQGGRVSEPPSHGLTECLRELGFETDRMKTGTPVRIDGRSVRWEHTTPQLGDEPGHHFSFLPDSAPTLPQLPCHILYTNATTHAILRNSLDRSPLYNGQIQSIGPRYCPSIETKIVTFPDKEEHQLFLEPEGAATQEYYLNGFSSSLPLEVQIEALQSIPAFEDVAIYRPGYAIEYDFFPPTQLHHSLETKLVHGLYFAGQINGTTGYEEAAGQGLMAGINAARATKSLPPVVLGRDQAYIGVLIDDLVTKGVDEPYRMFTSRAEHRILLRQDDADMRLTPIGHAIGLASDQRYELMQCKQIQRDKLIEWTRTYLVKPNVINTYLEQRGLSTLQHSTRLHDLLLRPQLTFDDLTPILPELAQYIETNIEPQRRNEIIEAAQILIKYQGYIDREMLTAQKLHRLEDVRLSPDFDYTSIHSLSTEARQKLSHIRPISIAQASRIPGVSPADINILLLLLGR